MKTISIEEVVRELTATSSMIKEEGMKRNYDMDKTRDVSEMGSEEAYSVGSYQTMIETIKIFKEAK